jgi:cytoskeletal protein CcmA (bactofilin family)
VPATPNPPAAPAPPAVEKDVQREAATRAKTEEERARALAEEALREAEAQAAAEMKRERIIRRRVEDEGDDETNGQIVRMGQDVVIESGDTVDEVVVIGGDLTVRGEVAGDAVAVGGDLQVEAGGRVTGDAVSIGGELDIEDGGIVDGDQVEVANVGPILIPGFGHVRENGPSTLVRIAKSVLKLLAILFIGWLAMVLFGSRLAAFADTVQGDFWRSLLVGLLVLVLWLPAVFLSAITVIGIPVAILLVIGVPIALLVGYFIGALAFGRRLAAGINLGAGSPLAYLLVGLVAIGLLILLGQVLGIADVLGPVSWAFKFVGWTLLSFATILGTGALAMMQMEYLRARRAAPGPAAPPPAPEPPPPPPPAGPESGGGEGPASYRGKLVWDSAPPVGDAEAGAPEHA